MQASIRVGGDEGSTSASRPQMWDVRLPGEVASHSETDRAIGFSQPQVPLKGQYIAPTGTF